MILYQCVKSNITHEIEACVIHFCIKILETGYSVMGKKLITEISKITGRLTGYSVKFHSSTCLANFIGATTFCIALLKHNLKFIKVLYAIM